MCAIQSHSREFDFRCSKCFPPFLHEDDAKRPSDESVRSMMGAERPRDKDEGRERGDRRGANARETADLKRMFNHFQHEIRFSVLAVPAALYPDA